MIKFIKFIFKTGFLILLILVVLDFVYTFVKINSNPRNKIDQILNSKKKEFDIVILGSSRAENHLIPAIFIKSGFKTFNYGISGSGLNENDLELKLMLKNGFKIKNLLLQVDLNILNNETLKNVEAQFMPYLHYSQTIRSHYRNLKDYNKIFYIPFYRYINYESEIGFRETIFTIFNKKNKILNNDGFVPLNGKIENLYSPNFKIFPQKNSSYEEIKFICKKNNIKLISISTPVCQNNNNNNYFKKVIDLYPEIKDFHSLIKDDKYFYSCGHMNNDGAKLFTEIVLDSIYLKK